MELEFLCYGFTIDNEQYRLNEKTFFDNVFSENKNFDFDTLKTQFRLTAAVDTEYEECFNRTDFLSEICRADEIEYTSYRELITDKNLYTFGFEAVYEPKTDNFDLYMTEEYIGKEKVPLDETEQTRLNSAVKTFIESAIDKYKTEKENQIMGNNDYNYCSRVFYDIAHEDFKSAEEAFSVIRPALEEFFRSEEYLNANIGLYEAAKTFVDKHESPSPDESVLVSEDFKKFEAFVSKYTELDEKGVDFTIDDKVFDKPTSKTSVIKE